MFSRLPSILRVFFSFMFVFELTRLLPYRNMYVFVGLLPKDLLFGVICPSLQEVAKSKRCKFHR